MPPSDCSFSFSDNSVFSISISDIVSCNLFIPQLGLLSSMAAQPSSSIDRGMEGENAKVSTWVSDEKHQDCRSVNWNLLTTNRLSLSRRLLKGVELRGPS